MIDRNHGPFERWVIGLRGAHHQCDPARAMHGPPPLKALVWDAVGCIGRWWEPKNHMKRSCLEDPRMRMINLGVASCHHSRGNAFETFWLSLVCFLHRLRPEECRKLLWENFVLDAARGSISMLLVQVKQTHRARCLCAALVDVSRRHILYQARCESINPYGLDVQFLLLA